MVEVTNEKFVSTIRESDFLDRHPHFTANLKITVLAIAILAFLAVVTLGILHGVGVDKLAHTLTALPEYGRALIFFSLGSAAALGIFVFVKKGIPSITGNLTPIEIDHLSFEDSE